MCEVGNMVKINVGFGHGDEKLSNSTDFSRVWYKSKNELTSQETYKREE